MSDLQDEQIEGAPEMGVSADGIDRRGFLKCMAWAGTGLVWTFAGGVPTSRAFGEGARGGGQSDFSFVQISDSHIGFNKPANPDVLGTLQTAIININNLERAPDFLIHTGDVRGFVYDVETHRLREIEA